MTRTSLIRGIWRTRPLIPAALAFAAGAAAGTLMPFSTEAARLVGMALAVFSTGLVLSLVTRRMSPVRCIRLAVLCLLTALALSLRWSHERLFVTDADRYDGISSCETLEVSGFPYETSYGVAVAAKLGRLGVTLYADAFDAALEPGYTITARFSFNRTDSGSRPLRATLRGAQEITAKKPIRYLPERIRYSVQTKITALFSGDSGAVVLALLTGDRHLISEELSLAFSEAGLSHTIAVSGMHISFVAAIIITLTGGRLRGVAVTIAAIWLFAAITGFPPSAVRACVMQSASLIAPKLRRDFDALSALSAALLFLLLLDPSLISSISLQLSFASTLGVLLFAQSWSQRLSGRMKSSSPILRYACGVLSCSVAATLFTAPLTAFYFGIFSIVGPLCNLLGLWALSAAFCLAAAAVAVSYLFYPAAVFLARIVHIALGLFIGTARAAAAFPFSAIGAGSLYERLIILFLYAFCVSLLISKPSRLCLARMASCAVCVVIALAFMASRRAALEIRVIDVGQGQSVLLYSQGRTALIDCGGNSGTVASAVARELKSLGKTRLDAVLLTHAHADHAGALPELSAMLDIDRLIVPAHVQTEAPWLDELAQTHGMITGYIAADTEIAFGAGSLRLYAASGGEDENERCMSILCSYGGFNMLFTGDLDAAAERTLLRRAEIPVLDVLMAGHHGSDGSCSGSLLEATQPQAAVISVGENNYGHPGAETLARLSPLPVYRTDLSGNILIKVGA